MRVDPASELSIQLWPRNPNLYRHHYTTARIQWYRLSHFLSFESGEISFRAFQVYVLSSEPWLRFLIKFCSSSLSSACGFSSARAFWDQVLTRTKRIRTSLRKRTLITKLYIMKNQNINFEKPVHFPQIWSWWHFKNLRRGFCSCLLGVVYAAGSKTRANITHWTRGV